VGLCGAKAHEYHGNGGGDGSILRLGRRTRAGLSLTLGVLIGFGLVILPGILTPSTQTSTTSGSNSGGTLSFGSARPGNLGNQPTRTSIGTTVGSMLILVSLVLSPALALSFLARYWTLKQAKNRFISENR